MDISNHASQRLKERGGIKKVSVIKNANRAYIDGMRHCEASGRLKKYFDYLFFLYPKTSNNVRIYNDLVYIFTVNRELITVIPLPSEHRAAYQKYRKRKIKSESEV